MARLTVIVGPFMVCGERMVKRSTRKSVGTVTLRTLPGKMIRRRRVARSTIRETHMVKAGITKVVGILMTGGARTRVMIRWRTVAG